MLLSSRWSGGRGRGQADPPTHPLAHPAAPAPHARAQAAWWTWARASWNAPFPTCATSQSRSWDSASGSSPRTWVRGPGLLAACVVVCALRLGRSRSGWVGGACPESPRAAHSTHRPPLSKLTPSPPACHAPRRRAGQVCCGHRVHVSNLTFLPSPMPAGALASFAAATEFTFGSMVQRVMTWPGGGEPGRVGGAEPGRVGGGGAAQWCLSMPLVPPRLQSAHIDTHARTLAAPCRQCASTTATPTCGTSCS